MNFLQETERAIIGSGHRVKDIVFIGTEGGLACSWARFREMANVEYDNSYGAQEVDAGLKIVFADQEYLSRGEYDGSEWWEHCRPVKIPTETRPLDTPFGRGY